MSAEHLDWIPKRGVISIVGDYRFPIGTTKFLSPRRKEAFNRIIGTIGYTDPSVVYGMPSEGVNLNILMAISQVDEVKPIMVNPCPGFFEYLTHESKALLRQLIEDLPQTITVKSKPGALDQRTKILEESLHFMARNSDAIFLIYNSKDKTKRFAEIENILMKHEGKTIHVDYAI